MRKVNVEWHSAWLDPVFFVISSSGLGWVQVIIILFCFPWKAFLGGARTGQTSQPGLTQESTQTANFNPLPSPEAQHPTPNTQHPTPLPKYDIIALLSGRMGKAPLLLYSWAFTGIVDTAIKHAVPRDRPSNEPWALPQEDVHAWSFASGHTAGAFGLAWVIFFMTRNTPNSKWGWAALVWGALVGFSRIYRGVHWPSDVASGFCVGLMCACVFMAVLPKPPVKRGGGRVDGKG